MPENGYLCIFNIQGKRSITQRRVAAAHYTRPAETSLSHLLCRFGGFQVGPGPRASTEPLPPQGDVGGAKGQASLSLEPQDQPRDRVRPHPLLYRPVSKTQRGWVARAGSHSILPRPGFLHPHPQWWGGGGDSLLTMERGRTVLSFPVSRHFFGRPHPVSDSLNSSVSLGLSGSQGLSLRLSHLFLCLFHPWSLCLVVSLLCPISPSCLTSFLSLRNPVLVHPCLPDFVLGPEVGWGGLPWCSGGASSCLPQCWPRERRAPEPRTHGAQWGLRLGASRSRSQPVGASERWGEPLFPRAAQWAHQGELCISPPLRP